MNGVVQLAARALLRVVRYTMRFFHWLAGAVVLWPLLLAASLYLPDMVQTRTLFSER